MLPVVPHTGLVVVAHIDPVEVVAHIDLVALHMVPGAETVEAVFGLLASLRHRSRRI